MLIFNREAWVEIYHTLSKNKLRTILTMIGVAWGMFLYIFLLGAAKGVENGFHKIFEGYATNSIFLWPTATGESYKGFSRDRKVVLTLDDVDYLKSQVPEIEYIIPRSLSSIEQGQIVRNNVVKNYIIFGDLPLLTEVESKALEQGRFINEGDIQESRKVTVIGREVVEQLFKNNENPIGQYIKINGINFQIVGVYRSLNPDIVSEDSVYIPFNTFQAIYNKGNIINWVIISIKDQYNVTIVETKIKSLLRERHNVSPTDERAFESYNFATYYKKLTVFVSGMHLLTWIVGGLTILAGVIAISNILLITVKERTLEIGIRRALGARPNQIKGQVLMESIFLTLFSGLIGFIFGVLSLNLMTIGVSTDPSIPFYNPSVSITSIFVALFLMISLGLLIGLIPAQRAVQIKPIEALRSE